MQCSPGGGSLDSPLEQIVIDSIVSSVKAARKTIDCVVYKNVYRSNATNQDYLVLLSGIGASLDKEIVRDHSPAYEVLCEYSVSNIVFASVRVGREGNRDRMSVGSDRGK
jgi:hypothetical protein